MATLSDDELAIRAHDITVCMEDARDSEFDRLPCLGNAVRLALHLRGAAPIDYRLLRRVAQTLSITPAETNAAVRLLAEAEFVRLDTEGSSINSVHPDVPYFADLYATLARVEGRSVLTEAETLAVTASSKLARSPQVRESLQALGAEAKLLDRVVDLGIRTGFFVLRRARGKDILINPTTFAEGQEGFADLVAHHGASPVSRVVGILQKNQGWPLQKMEAEQEVNGSRLSAQDLRILRALAGAGFLAPPAIKTEHSGENFFLFGPRPGASRVPLNQREILERAMVLVAAVRQGQLLANQFRVRHPIALLRALRDRGFLAATSETFGQYAQVARRGVARLEREGSSRHRLVLVDTRENAEALTMAITLMSGDEVDAQPDEDARLALRGDEHHLDALLGRKKLMNVSFDDLDEEARREVDTLLMGEVY